MIDPLSDASQHPSIGTATVDALDASHFRYLRCLQLETIRVQSATMVAQALTFGIYPLCCANSQV